MTSNKKSYLFASLAIIFWSTVAAAFKIALEHATIPQILLIASATSFAIFGLILYFIGFKKVLEQSSQEIMRSAVLGLLNPFAYYLILFKAYSLLPAQVAQPLNQIWPLILAILAVPILKQKLPKTTLTSLIICFVGVFLISSQGEFRIFNQSNPLGVALALSSSIIWSLYWLLNVKDTRDFAVKLFTNFGFSVVYILAISPFIDGFYNFSLTGIASSVYVGVFEMGIGFLFWMKALEHAKSAAKIGLMVYLVPFISLVFIHFIVGEQIKPTTIAGLSIIVLGILYQQKDQLFKRK
jgi:drug/metabolite transporter (DMT)-like permease